MALATTYATAVRVTTTLSATLAAAGPHLTRTTTAPMVSAHTTASAMLTIT